MSKMHNNIKAVIFDHDGIIINTEFLISKAWEYILKEHGKKPILTKEGLVHTQGLVAADNWRRLREKYNINSDFDTSFKKRNEFYFNLLKTKAKPMPGLFALLNLLKENNFKTAITSNALKAAIDTVVEKLKIKEYFDIIISGEKLKRGKPFPDIFLLTAKELGVSPEHCLVLEDTAIGIEAAKNAGMKAIAIPTEYTKNQDFSKADKIVKNLKDIDLNLINSYE